MLYLGRHSYNNIESKRYVIEKHCSRCKINKSWSEFYKRTSNKDGLTYWCKECIKETVKISTGKNRQSNQEASVRWKKANPLKDKIHKRVTDLKRKYNITLEEYQALYEQQGGVCYICYKECARGTQLSVDHNHLTGEVRGLLCRKCNLGLGNFQDSITLLNQAIDYLS